jgi:hypothetical protein
MLADHPPRCAVNCSILFTELPLLERPAATAGWCPGRSARPSSATAWPWRWASGSGWAAGRLTRYPLRTAADAVAVIDRVAAETGVANLGLLFDPGQGW